MVANDGADDEEWWIFQKSRLSTPHSGRVEIGTKQGCVENDAVLIQITSIACLSISSADTNSTGRECNIQTGFVFLVRFDFNIVSLIRNHVTLITQHVGNRAFVFQTGLDHVKAGTGRGEYIEKQGAIYGHKTREYISTLQFFNVTRCSRSDVVTEFLRID